MHVKTHHSYESYFALLETVHDISAVERTNRAIHDRIACLHYPQWCRGIPIRFVLHILYQILNVGNREKAIVRPRAPTIQPCLLLIVIPACRRIMNCISRYRVARILASRRNWLVAFIDGFTGSCQISQFGMLGITIFRWSCTLRVQDSVN